jgi:uncharacterized protein (TIGR03086 family)
VDSDLLELYERASEWTTTKVRGASSQLDAPTTCESWNVRTLLNHMLQIQRRSLGAGRGETIAVDLLHDPPDLLSDDPACDFDQTCAEMLRTFSEPGVIQNTGIALTAAFGDLLFHGWDVAVSTVQDATMPEGLPEAALVMVHGRFTEEQREGVFKPEINVDPASSAQEKLLAYSGRDPAQGA